MKAKLLVVSLLSLYCLVAAAHPRTQENRIEAEIRQLEQVEVRAVMERDKATLEKLWVGRYTGQSPPPAFDWLYPYSFVLLSFAYASGLLLLFSYARAGPAHRLTAMFAAAGRMALSNYLAQSVIFSALFYGFAGGLFGRLGSAVAALIGLTVFIAQLVTSHWWLKHFRFGPAEGLWRTLTYRR